MNKKINRRQFISRTATGIGAITAGSVFSSLSCTKTTKRPNILLVMVDDMGYSDLGCFGSEIDTPNVNNLANNGIRFTRFYNASRCCPTRASLMTGLYPHEAGIGDMVGSKYNMPSYQGYLNDESVTIAEVMKSAGYTTLMSGKWHVGEHKPHWPCDRGFDRYFGLISGAANYWDITKGKAPNVNRQMALNNDPWTPPKEGFYMTDAITDHAVEFLNENISDTKPFFMYLAFTAPHWPLHAWPQDIAKYKGKYMMGWDELRRIRYKRMVEMGIIDEKWDLSPRDPQAMAWEEVKDKELMDSKMATYAAMLDRMDQNLGRVLNTIKEKGQEENTLIMFLSDNGACHESGPLGFDRRDNGLPVGGVDSYMSYGLSWSNAGNTPFRMHKHWVHEGGISTPFIAKWPAVIKNTGGLNTETGHIVDVMATCVDVAGADYPEIYNGKSIKPMRGKSLVPVFKAGERNGHEYLFWEHEGNKAVRHGNWKLVSKDNDEWELYDLELDRSELNNLAKSKPDQVEQLIAKWTEWAKEVGVYLG